MTTEQKLAQADVLVVYLELMGLALAAEIVRGLIRLVRELEAGTMYRRKS